MNTLTLLLIRLAFLAVLWLFVIAAVGVVRTDLFGHAHARAASGGASGSRRRRRRRRPPQAGRAGAGYAAATAGNRRARWPGTSIGLTDQQITIGRANDATLVLNDDYASTDTPGCSRRTVSGSLRISGRPTARTSTGRR